MALNLAPFSRWTLRVKPQRRIALRKATHDIRSSFGFALLIPKAIAWAEAQSFSIGQIGQPLNDALLSVARSVGVIRPELIRVAEVPALPMPEDLELQQAALATGLLGPNMIGMTFGYGIYVCHGQGTIRLLSHEFRHAFQYEQAGSIAVFLPDYLQQIVTVGYHNAPFEIDARAHERHHA